MDERNELQKNRGAFLFFLSSLSAFGVDVELEMDEDTRVFGCFYAATFFPAEARLSRGIPEIALKVVKEGKSRSIFQYDFIDEYCQSTIMRQEEVKSHRALRS